MARRPSFTKFQRVKIFDAHGGICHLCRLKIHAERGERWHVEHVKARAFGGSDEFSNLAPAHVDCHKPKSIREHQDRCKADRVRARHIGAKPKRPWHPTLRRKVNGQIVPRREDRHHGE